MPSTRNRKDYLNHAALILEIPTILRVIRYILLSNILSFFRTFLFTAENKASYLFMATCMRLLRFKREQLEIYFQKCEDEVEIHGITFFQVLAEYCDNRSSFDGEINILAATYNI